MDTKTQLPFPSYLSETSFPVCVGSPRRLRLPSPLTWRSRRSRCQSAGRRPTGLSCSPRLLKLPNKHAGTDTVSANNLWKHLPAVAVQWHQPSVMITVIQSLSRRITLENRRQLQAVSAIITRTRGENATLCSCTDIKADTTATQAWCKCVCSLCQLRTFHSTLLCCESLPMCTQSRGGGFFKPRAF